MNRIKMKPTVTSLGYNKVTGKKIIKRSYIFEKIETKKENELKLDKTIVVLNNL